MFDRNVAYRKSGKGAEAIASRSHGLAPRLRSLLIIVDGKKSGGDLLKFAANLGDGEAMVKDLITGEFIEAVPGSQTAAGTETSAKVSSPSGSSANAEPETPAAARATNTLPEAKRLAVRLLVDLMGPMADGACMAIESAKTPDQFMTAVRKAHDQVHSFRGENAATKFREQVEANFP